nr:hypothetical protein [Tanacetum cinerariifolium]
LSHVKSTPAHINLETISQTDGARSSRVPILLYDDPYMEVRQAYLATFTDSEYEPFEDAMETEELQSLAARIEPPQSVHTPSSPDPIFVSPLTSKEFEAFEPSDTRITTSHSIASSDSTTPLFPDHPLTQTLPTPTLSRPMYYHRTARMAVRTQ